VTLFDCFWFGLEWILHKSIVAILFAPCYTYFSSKINKMQLMQKENKMGELSKAIRLKEEINKMKLKVCEMEADLGKMERENRPTEKYGDFEVTVSTEGNRFSGIPEGTEMIRITAKLLNIEEKNEHLNIFGCIVGDWKEFRRSVAYYRVYGVLLHDGGGYLLLNDKVPCSDEEWEEIKKGNFGKFMNPRITN
jgi:hypothetical protein